MAGSLSVGARLETVEPRPLTDQADRLHVFILLVVAILVHTWVVLRTEMTARDSIGFARTAMQLIEPSAARLPQDPPTVSLSPIDVVLRSQHPPGYSVAVLAMSQLLKLVHPVADEQLPGQLLLATQLVSAVAGVLLILPMYWLGRMLLGKPMGFAATFMFQLLPVPARITSDGLTEGLYLLFLAVALFLAARAIRLPGIKQFLVCGIAVGLTYLIRPEGLLVAVALTLTLFVQVLRAAIPRRLAMGMLTALVVGFGLSAGWYMILIGGITQKPTGTTILKSFNPRKQLQEGQAANPPAANAKPTLLAEWYNPEVHGSRSSWIAQAFFKEGGKAFHYVPLALSLIGCILVFPKRREQPEWLVLYWYGLLFFGVLFAMTALKPYDALNRPYLSERHLLPLVYLGCFFSMAALVEMSKRFFPNREPLAKWSVRIVWWAILLSCIPSLTRSLHSSRLGHKEAGEIIRMQASEADTIIDPFDYALWYSGRSFKSIQPDPPPLPGTYRWAVLESGDNPNSATPRLPAALAVANDQENKAEVVKWWPSDKPESEAKVRLLKQMIR